MNTRVSVVKSYKGTDNLLILADTDKLIWAKEFLSKAEQGFLKKAIKNEVPYVFIPQENRYIIVQFSKEGETISELKEEARLAGSEILSTISHYKIREVVIINQSVDNRALEYLEGMVLGNYQFLKYFNDPKEKSNTLQSVKIHENSTTRIQVKELIAVTSSTCKARDLVNEPLSYLSAMQLSREIKALGKEHGIKVEVLNKRKIEALKMGGILAVNKGSIQPPSFNILEWKPKNAKNKKPVVLVGKGVVYDTGGVSLKQTPNGMDKMKCDMAGAATVIGSILAIAKSKIPVHIIALIPATDNRPGNEAYVPGDVITMYDGSTVEVLNTDAEGRLILADALHYAKKYKPELVLDFATLTGSAAQACGQNAICFMGNADEAIKQKVIDSGNEVYERLVQFPLWKEYGEQLKSNIADLKNLGGPTAGMITAGKFLEHFVEFPWLHFDIAGPAFIKNADGYRSKEGTGVGVRLMFDFLKKYLD